MRPTRRYRIGPLQELRAHVRTRLSALARALRCCQRAMSGLRSSLCISVHMLMGCSRVCPNELLDGRAVSTNRTSSWASASSTRDPRARSKYGPGTHTCSSRSRCRTAGDDRHRLGWRRRRSPGASTCDPRRCDRRKAHRPHLVGLSRARRRLSLGERDLFAPMIGFSVDRLFASNLPSEVRL